jgi:hypothetical protein
LRKNINDEFCELDEQKQQESKALGISLDELLLFMKNE